MSHEAGTARKCASFNRVLLGHEFCADVVDFGPDATHVLATSALLQSAPPGTLEAHAPQKVLMAVGLHAVSKSKLGCDEAVQVLAAGQSGWR